MSLSEAKAGFRAADLLHRSAGAKLEYRPYEQDGHWVWYWTLRPFPSGDALEYGEAPTRGQASLSARQTARKLGRPIRAVEVISPEVQAVQGRVTEAVDAKAMLMDLNWRSILAKHGYTGTKNAEGRERWLKRKIGYHFVIWPPQGHYDGEFGLQRYKETSKGWAYDYWFNITSLTELEDALLRLETADMPDPYAQKVAEAFDAKKLLLKTFPPAPYFHRLAQALADKTGFKVRGPWEEDKNTGHPKLWFDIELAPIIPHAQARIMVDAALKELQLRPIEWQYERQLGTLYVRVHDNVRRYPWGAIPTKYPRRPYRPQQWKKPRRPAESGSTVHDVPPS